MLRIFIGFDPRQPVAYQVLHHSIIRRSSKPVSITPLVLGQLPLKRTGLTPFTFSRYLVPWLCGFDGTALFLDTDILVLGDIAELFSYADESKAVVVSKNPLRFEWPSVMLFNCAHPDNRVLTPDHVESADRLHMIGWTEHVGEFPGEWNHLVMYDEPKRAMLVSLHGRYPDLSGNEGSRLRGRVEPGAKEVNVLGFMAAADGPIGLCKSCIRAAAPGCRCERSR